MSARNVLQTAFDEFAKSAGFTKESGTWCRRQPDVIGVIELQKSQYGAQYFANVALWLLDDDDRREALLALLTLRLLPLLEICSTLDGIRSSTRPNYGVNFSLTGSAQNVLKPVARRRSSNDGASGSTAWTARTCSREDDGCLLRRD